MKITCNIIKDLLPLYIDDVLSDDSKKAVEEHIKKCAVCTAYLHELTHNSIDDIPSKHIEDIMPLKNVKKTLLKKRILTAAFSFVTAFLIAAALWYGIFIKESYVPYKDSGIIMDGSTLNVTEDYYGVYGSTAPDQETVFLYLSSTVYTRHHSIDKPETIMDFGGVSSIETDEKGNTVKYSTKEVYYVPEKYAKEFKLTGHEREGISFPSNAEKAETATADIKKQSVLIWKAAN